MTAERHRLLPDTCAWIDFLNGRDTSLASRIDRDLRRGELFTCGVVRYELAQGLRDEKEEQAVSRAMAALRYVEMTPESWSRAARLSSTLRKGGKTLPMSDLLIAALALDHGLTVLTEDRHFAMVPGLKTAG